MKEHLRRSRSRTGSLTKADIMTMHPLHVLVLTCVTLFIGGQARAKPARNPVIWADVPDVAAIRVGDTYYMASTTMYMSPGLPIMKSKDLVNWELIGYAYDTLTDNDAQADLKVDLVSIGDYVWWDVDRDGQQDASEPVVPGVIVNLYDEFGALVGTTTTGDNGYYAFTSLQPGMPYSVEFIKPDGSVFTYQMQGDAASDSNADRATGKTPVFTTPTSGNNLATPGQADDPTIDAGLWSKINLVVAKHLATDGPFVQGDEITFYLSPSNEGPMDALAGWSVTEVLPEGLTLGRSRSLGG